MKYLKTLLIIICAINFVSAQDTDAPIFSSSNVWVQYESGWFPNVPKRHSFGTDSIYLGTHHYKTVRVSYDSTGNNWNDLDAHYRHDNGKIYSYNPNGDDYLQMDFNLIEGDTFRSEILLDDIVYLIVESVDTIELLDGSMKKRIGLSCYYDSANNIFCYWIKDVGSTSGGIHDATEYACAADIGFNLVCFHSEGELLYEDENDFFEGCWYTVTDTGTTDLDIPNLILFPNPTASNLNVNFDHNYDNYQYIIYDNIGKELQSGLLTRTINIDNLPLGIYNIMIKKGSSSQVYKFVKN